MLAITTAPDERLTPARRAKLAYIYVRQSSVTQVKHHQESTELQYRLVDRAVDLGWPRERVQVIDEDLGKSGAGHADRQGFQKLIAEIGLGNAGLVISLDASRLARNNRDWHQLLELCSLFGVIIADGERLYDPGAYHDRLLLGLSGIMSEAELHQIRVRLHQGELQKAARGELRMPLPGGLVHDRGGQITLNPDEEVQARLRLVFAKFRELQSARAVMLYLRRNALRLPVRPLFGPSPMNSSGERRAPVRFDISCITRLTRELMFTGVEQCKPRLGRPKRGRRALRSLWASGRSAFYQPTLATSAGRSS